MKTTLTLKGVVGGLLAIGTGVAWLGWHGIAHAETSPHIANPSALHIPAPRTFHTNQLPIPTTAAAVPSGPLPSTVTITSGRARAIAIQWIEFHRPTKKIVPPVITGITLISQSAAEQQTGAQPGLSPYLWKVTFRSTDFELFGMWPRGSIFINTENGTVPIADGKV